MHVYHGYGSSSRSDERSVTSTEGKGVATSWVGTAQIGSTHTTWMGSGLLLFTYRGDRVALLQGCWRIGEEELVLSNGEDGVEAGASACCAMGRRSPEVDRP